MSKFFDQRKIDELSKKLAGAIPENYQTIKGDLEENFKSEEEKDSFSSLNENMGEKN